MVTYTFVEAQSPEQRRLPWDRMQAENLTRALAQGRTHICGLAGQH